MRVSKKRCACCRRWFQPNPRTAAFQKFCPSPRCRCQSRLLSHRTWWRDNGAVANAARAPKLRAWAKSVGYWRRYRAEHPDHARRDNERRRRAKRTAKRAAKQDTMRRISVGMLYDIQALTVEKAAKQDMIHRRVDGIVDYLLWKERSAKQDSMSQARASA